MSNQGKNSLLGKILLGPLLIIISIVVLWSNEGNNMRASYGLQEAQEIAINVSKDSVLQENNGKLVHTSGNLVGGKIHDKLTGFEEDAIILKREVLMYQWVEEEHSKNDTTTYTYEKKWKE